MTEHSRSAKAWHFSPRWYPFNRQCLLWSSPMAWQTFCQMCIEIPGSPAQLCFLLLLSFKTLPLNKIFALLCLRVCLSQDPTNTVWLYSFTPSLSVCLSLSPATPKIHPLSQTPCGKFPRNDFPLQVGGCILRHAVRKGGSGGLIMAIYSISLYNSILE